MSETAIEDHLYEFILAAVDAANDEAAPDENSPFFEVVLHDTIYRPITSDQHYYIQVGNCDSDFAPSFGGDTIKEFDGDVTVITLARVLTEDRSDRKAARGKALSLAKAVAKLLLDDPTMGGRVNDSRVLKCLRDWTSINSEPFALANVPLILNETGRQ
jgi:hypothetical protein